MYRGNLNISLFVNGMELDSNKNVELKKAIFETAKEGDVISWFPFNHFGDENSDFKSELEDYHVKPLKIKKIDRNYIDSWNGGVKVVINIHLEIIRKKKCSVC